MKMKQKKIFLIFVIIICLAMASCGHSNNSVYSDNENLSNSEEESITENSTNKFENGSNNVDFNVTDNYINVLNNVDTYIRIDKNGNVDSRGSYLLFGCYPQTEIDDEKIKTILTSMAGNVDSWTPFDYYSCDDNKGFGFYKDLTWKNNTYRGIYFNQYRPTSVTEYSNEGNSEQDDNGYFANTIYWFRYEPIKWEILKEDVNTFFIASLNVLDNMEYYSDSYCSNHFYTDQTCKYYANNYAYSTLRNWLNKCFYRQAFSEKNMKIIKNIIVDNSVSEENVVNQKSIQFACENTNDYIFPLSSKEISEYLSETQIIKNATPYAICQGAVINETGNCSWWIRTPGNSSTNNTKIKTDGQINQEIYGKALGGVVPSLQIKKY